MTAFAEPVVAWRGATQPDAPLVLRLHGRGSNEADIIAVADHVADAAVRAPIGEVGVGLVVREPCSPLRPNQRG